MLNIIFSRSFWTFKFPLHPINKEIWSFVVCPGNKSDVSIKKFGQNISCGYFCIRRLWNYIRWYYNQTLCFWHRNMIAQTVSQRYEILNESLTFWDKEKLRKALIYGALRSQNTKATDGIRTRVSHIKKYSKKGHSPHLQIKVYPVLYPTPKGALPDPSWNNAVYMLRT